MIIFEGFILGFSTIIFIGPVFFYLLKTTLEKGVKFGIMVALGIIVSDILCAAICSTGISSFLTDPGNQNYIAISGGSILLLLGLKYIIKPVAKQNPDKPISSNLLSVFTQGFLINFINPFVFMVWIGFIVYGESNTPNTTSLVLFIIAILIGIFASDIFKIFISSRIRKYLEPKYLSVVFRVIGVILVLFSIRLLLFSII